MTLKSIGVVSCGKILGAIYTVLGLIVGSCFALVAVVATVIPQPEGAQQPAVPFLILGVAALFVMPLLYGAMGFLFGALAALIYNLFAAWIGGIELELEPTNAAIRP